LKTQRINQIFLKETDETGRVQMKHQDNHAMSD